jgi:hypothetical protein
MRLLFASMFVIGALAFAPKAHADDFTFTVPVRVENMRLAENVRVNCSVIEDLPTPHAITIGGSAPVPLVDGAFNGTVTVVVNVSRGWTRADADRWECGLVYTWRMPDGTLFNRSLYPGERNTQFTRYTGQAVASSTLSVGGPVVR